MSAIRTIVRGSTEYLKVTVTCDVTLDAQVVEFSFDNSTWITAEWVGAAGLVRTARILLEGDDQPSPTTNKIYVRVTDSPEIPVMFAGQLVIRD